MLVLSRKVDEKIIIGVGEDQIEIMVVHIDANKVKIGVKAPNNVTIDRQEVHDKKSFEIQHEHGGEG